MFRQFRRKPSVFLSLFLLVSGQSLALPNPSQGIHRTREEFVRRQDGPFNGPQTVQSVTHTPTPFGIVTETCITTLTPIVDQAGHHKVLAVKECTVVMSGNNEGQSGTQTASLSTTTAQSSTTAESTSTAATTSPTTLILTSTSFSTATTDSTSAQTTQTPPPPPTLTTTTDAVSTTSSTTNAESGSTEISVIGTTTVPNSVVTSPAVSATSVDGVVGTDPPTGTTEGSPSATQAAENNASSSAAAEFQLPGKQLQVLPIGLGVFAGISVIALIVVALVTYERTKYRKAFRQRKLAESGAAMGYGGMTSR